MQSGEVEMEAECWQALAEREENVRNGRLTTIIYIRDRNGRGQEISGYIDYAHRSGRFSSGCMTMWMAAAHCGDELASDLQEEFWIHLRLTWSTAG